jgi:hypothetical protein
VAISKCENISKNQLSENGFYSKGMNNLSQSRLTYAKEIKGNNAVFLGLTFNFLNTDHSGMSDGEYKMDIAPGYIYERFTDIRRYAMWPGLNVGFRF